MGGPTFSSVCHGEFVCLYAYLIFIFSANFSACVFPFCEYRSSKPEVVLSDDALDMVVAIEWSVHSKLMMAGVCIGKNAQNPCHSVTNRPLLR